jgi:hypothetical protein
MGEKISIVFQSSKWKEVLESRDDRDRIPVTAWRQKPEGGVQERCEMGSDTGRRKAGKECEAGEQVVIKWNFSKCVKAVVYLMELGIDTFCPKMEGRQEPFENLEKMEATEIGSLGCCADVLSPLPCVDSRAEIANSRLCEFCQRMNKLRW